MMHKLCCLFVVLIILLIFYSKCSSKPCKCSPNCKCGPLCMCGPNCNCGGDSFIPLVSTKTPYLDTFTDVMARYIKV